MITFKNSLKLILIHLFIYSVISVNAAGKDINYQKPKMCWVIEDNIRITQPVKIRFYILKDTAIPVSYTHLNIGYNCHRLVKNSQ